MIRIIKWAGTISTAIAAIAIAFIPHIASSWLPFFGYGMGALFWAIAGIKTKDWPLTLLNVLFIFVNLYAICIRL